MHRSWGTYEGPSPSRRARALARLSVRFYVFINIANLFVRGTSMSGLDPRNIEEFKENHDVESLILALKDGDRQVRQDAVIALGHLGGDRALDGLVAALKDEVALVREFAVRALGRSGDERAVPPLIEALGDENRHVQDEVARSLGFLGGPEADQALHQFRQKRWGVLWD
jgi:HEAT repeat protein